VDRCTIDLDRESLDEDAMDRAERAANVVVMADLPVVAAWYPDAASAPRHLRKEAPAEGPVRVVAVGTFDATPCCGTHCDRAGQVGPIKVLRWERKKGGLRIEFVCGARAMGDYARRHRALRGLALALTVDEFDVPERVAAIQDEARAERARAEKAEAELRDGLLERWAVGQVDGAFVRDVGPGRAEWLAPMASALADRRGAPVLLTSADGAEGRAALAAPSGWPAHAGNVLRSLLAAHEGRGGGNDRLGTGKLPAGRLGELADAWHTSGGAADAEREGEAR
jgi:alanyl-tRNA synthetase